MTGLQLPETGGSRSSAALGREVVAAALAPSDPAAAERVRATGDWRSGYLAPFRQLLEDGLVSREAALAQARAGLDAARARLQLDGAPLSDGLPRDAGALELVEVKGEADRPEGELVLPYRGERLRGDGLRRQVDRWVERGTITSTCGQALHRVVDNPDWLELSDRTVVVLGAGAEMGPLQSLLRWGGDVVGVDLPRPDLWTRVLDGARAGAGTLRVPVRAGSRTAELPMAAGADLLTDLPALAATLRRLDGPLVLSNDVYADGSGHVLVSAAVDALAVDLLGVRDDVALAFLATPTDVYAVPVEEVERARAAGRRLSVLGLLRPGLRAVSLGRLLQRQYATTPLLEGEPVGVSDSLVPQQGPNYALAKRLQRWRAAVAASEGVTVSINVAPATRTRSVTKNKLLATAYAGAGQFGVEVFQPATSNVLMAALLVHDLRTGGSDAHPARVEMTGAAHGGFWTQPYEARTALPLAVVTGVGRG